MCNMIYIYIYIYTYHIQNRHKIYIHKIQTGGRGVEDIEFSGILKKYHVEILGVNRKRSEISSVNQRV